VELTYSTDPDWCSKCKHLPCQCSRPKTQSIGTAAPRLVKMRLEKRRGKPLVVLFELGMAPAQQKELLKEIQQLCGTGGCVKDGTLEIQGDHRERIEQLLSGKSIKVKRAGG